MTAEELLGTIDAEIVRLQLVRETITRLIGEPRGNPSGPVA